MSADDCIFCKIVAGEIPSDIVHETDTTVSFRDLNPVAPTHVLVIPKHHYENAAEVARHAPGTMADIVAAADDVAALEGLVGRYRLVFNTGSEAGQSVFHCHAHVLAGRSLTWPPG